MEDQIEKEVQARLDFKYQELITGITNRISSHTQVAFRSVLNSDIPTGAKGQHYKEAWQEFLDLLKKEFTMGTPFDDMANQNMKVRKNEATAEIMQRLKPHLEGRINPGGILDIQGFIARTIEKAQ